MPLAKWQRVLLGLSLPAAIALVCVYELRIGTGLKCWFYELTGLYCPGCGSGRAVQALLHGRIGQAFSYNILLLPLGLPCCAVVLHEYLRLVFPGLRLRPVYLSRPVQIACLILVFGFWILRNIPLFSVLAPGACSPSAFFF